MTSLNHAYSTQLTQLNRERRTQVSDTYKSESVSATIGNLTAWCCQNLSSRALNALTVQASTNEHSHNQSTI